jgi:hypothetical protein
MENAIFDVRVLRKSDTRAYMVMSQKRIYTRDFVVLCNASLYSGNTSTKSAAKRDFTRLILADEEKTLYSPFMYPLFEGSEPFHRIELPETKYHNWPDATRNDMEKILMLLALKKQSLSLNGKMNVESLSPEKLQEEFEYRKYLAATGQRTTGYMQFELLMEILKSHGDAATINEKPVNLLERIFAH